VNALNGTIIWKIDTAQIQVSLVVASGKILFISEQKLFVHNLSNGDYLWFFDPSVHYTHVPIAPVVADEKIYVVFWNLFCLGPMLYYDFTINPTFYDNFDEPLLPPPDSLTVRLPNGTRTTMRINEAYYSAMGTYSIEAIEWQGQGVGFHPWPSLLLDANVTWTPWINCTLPTESRITLRASTSFIGFNVQIDGTLTCNNVGVPGAPILLSYSVTGGDTWNDIMQVSSDLNGVYSADWLPSASGNYLVRAWWMGNATFPGSLVTVNLAVASFAEDTVFAVESNSTVSALTFNATSRELRFLVSGPIDTFGYARVSIAKSLIDTNTDLTTYIDGELVDHTVTSTDDTWLLHFTYPHSDHTVVVYLDDVSAKQSSTISCLLPYAEVPIGSAISVTGSIQPTPSDGTVTLTYVRPDDSVLNRTVPIATDGTYDDLYAPDLVGEWHVSASWPGDATLEGAVSTTRTFTVTATPTGIPVELIAFGVIGGLVFMLVLFARKRIL
jgi:hypothetical protein